MTLCKTPRQWLVMFGLLMVFAQSVAAPVADDYDDAAFFLDKPVVPEVVHPDWFKESLLELADDIEEAAENKKKGIMVYFI